MLAVTLHENCCMAEEELIKQKNEEFLELLENTKQIKNIFEIYEDSGGLENKISNKKISKDIYVKNFLMASILDAFMFRESLNLKELYNIVMSYKIPQDFIWSLPAKELDLIIVEMIKLGYIEPYRKEKTLVPIFQLTELGITTLQERTLQNLALTSFYSYQSYELNKRAINLSLIALAVSIVAIIVSIIITK